MLYFLITLISFLLLVSLSLLCKFNSSRYLQKSHNVINLFSVSFNKLNKKCFLFSENLDILISNCFSNFYMILKNRQESISYSFEWTQKLGIILSKNYISVTVQKSFFSAKQTEFLQNIHLQWNGIGKPLQNGKTTGS